MCSFWKFGLQECHKAIREYILLGEIVFGMIVISENVTVLSVGVISGAIVPGILISSQVIWDTSIISVHVRVLLGEWDIFKLLLGILTYHLAKRFLRKSSKFTKLMKYIWSAIEMISIKL